MEIRIIQSSDYKEPVNYKAIHGKYPYKLYLEVKGNNRYGKYIAIISDKPIKQNDNEIESVVIQLIEKLPDNRFIKKQQQITTKPNFKSIYELTFKVKEHSVLDVEKEKMFVFKHLNKNR